MSDANLIKDKIREEFEKGYPNYWNPSSKKVLSYLLELFNKDKYPSLSDFEFYDIVGDVYKLNLTKASSILSKKFGSEGVLKNAYKLNLKISFYPLYNDLKKKIKKLYGDEKWLEMEQYLIKNYGLFKEGFERVDPSIDQNWRLYRDLKISATLSELFPTHQHLFYTEFFDIVGEAFKSDPEFYLENIEGKVKKRAKKLYGDEKIKEMEKYIINKFCLLEDEQILFETEGRINIYHPPVKISIKSGKIFVTNYRLIAHGKLITEESQTGGSPSQRDKIIKEITRRILGFPFEHKGETD